MSFASWAVGSTGGALCVLAGVLWETPLLFVPLGVLGGVLIGLAAWVGCP